MVLVKVLAEQGETVSAVCARLGHSHSKGCGFYLLTKKESISADKEIILWTGSKYIQDAKLVRKELGFGAGAITVQPTQVPDGQELYVQSTSATRKLTPGPVILRVPKLQKPAADDDDDDNDDDGEEEGDAGEDEDDEDDAPPPKRTTISAAAKRKRDAEPARAAPPPKRAKTKAASPKAATPKAASPKAASPKAATRKAAKTKAATPNVAKVSDGGFSSGVSRVPLTDDLSTIEFYDEPAGEAFAEEQVPARFLTAASLKVFEAAHAAAQDWVPEQNHEGELRCWSSPSTGARLWLHDAKFFAALHAPALRFSVAVSLSTAESESKAKAFIRTPDFSYDAERNPEFGGASLTDYPVGLLACLAHAIWELGAHTPSNMDD